MQTSTVKLLETHQTQAFDKEYVCDELFKQVSAHLEIYSMQSEMDVLDVGGGNGTYCDRIISTFLNSYVTLLEPDAYLLSKNQKHHRKQVVKGTFQDTRFTDQSFDVIQFNWVLHHFIGNNYEESRRLQLSALREARRLLKPGGRIIILENFYDGMLMDNLPSRLIFELTANKLFAPLIKSAGANTAGVGVCFQSKLAWSSTVFKAGFQDIHIEHCYTFSELSWLKSILLGIRQQRVGLIVAR